MAATPCATVRTSAPHPRSAGIDTLRGITLIGMGVVNLGLGVAWVPAWLKHSADVGFTIADLGAPMFVVLSALSIGPAMRRRRDLHGTRAAIGWLAARGLALIGIGAIISAGQSILLPAQDGVALTWGVLQAIGAATLATSTVILLPASARAVIGLVILAAYEWLLNTFWLDIVRGSVQGGLPGALSWAGLMILATAIADAWRGAGSERRQLGLLAGVGLAATAVAVALAGAFPIAKVRASSTYMLLCLGLTLLLLAAFSALLDRRTHRLRRLQMVGRHPLPLYLAQLLLLAPLSLSGVDAVYAGAPPWLTAIEVVIMAGATVLIGALIERKGWSLRL